MVQHPLELNFLLHWSEQGFKLLNSLYIVARNQQIYSDYCSGAQLYFLIQQEEMLFKVIPETERRGSENENLGGKSPVTKQWQGCFQSTD